MWMRSRHSDNGAQEEKAIRLKGSDGGACHRERHRSRVFQGLLYHVPIPVQSEKNKKADKCGKCTDLCGGKRIQIAVIRLHTCFA